MATVSVIPSAILLLIAAASTGRVFTVTALPETTTRTFKVNHRLGSGAFTERGRVVISADVSSGSEVPLSANIVDAQPLVASAVDQMTAAGDMYTIEIVDIESGHSTMASVPGCDVRRASFREEIALTLSQTGSLLSASYTPLVSPLVPSCESLSPLATESKDNFSFKTTVTYEVGQRAMTVPLVLPKGKHPLGMKAYPMKRKASGEGGGTTEGGGSGSSGNAAFGDDEQLKNQSFLRKYWYIILPIMMLQFVGAPEPEPEQAGSGDSDNQVGSGAGLAASTVVAAAGTGTPVKRQRRGKRD